ncbi:Glycine receptor subunit alphaZ1-like protein, partial [Dinothrombium tinctorium]
VPTIINITIKVLNIRSISEKELVNKIKVFSPLSHALYSLQKTYTLDLFIHQEWFEPRLRIPRLGEKEEIVLDASFKNKLWLPNFFFKNAISGQVTNILFPVTYFKVFDGKKVLMSSRVSLQLYCDMCFYMFPHDTQKCSLEIMSLSNTNDTVILKLKSFDLTKNLMLTTFKRPRESSEDCTRSYDVGTYSCIRCSLVMKRRLPLYMLKIYIPSFIIVTISFVGFWVPMTAYPARVALVVTSLLSLITQQLQTTAALNASYIIAIDVWMLICKTFVFGGLIEFAFAVASAEKQSQESTTINYLLFEYGNDIVNSKNTYFKPHFPS